MPPIKLLVANQKTYLWDLHGELLNLPPRLSTFSLTLLPLASNRHPDPPSSAPHLRQLAGYPSAGHPAECLPRTAPRLAPRRGRSPRAQPYAPSLLPPRGPAPTESHNLQEASRMYDLEKRKEMEELHRDKIEKKRKEKEAKRKGRDDAEKALEQDDGEGEQTTGLPASAPSASTMPSRSAVPTPPPSTSLTPSNLPPTSTLPYTILIDPSSSSYAWYHPSSSAVSYPTIEAAQQAGVWNYPTNELQEARCRVFEDLWRKGYYMGGGLRFGGDFLVYPGDPLRYHSHFTLTVLSTPLTAIMPLDLVAYGRLATAVKKAHLLASYDADKGAAEYLSLEWAAFG
ncbi:SPOSA6832_01520, partial [Sporobolomyces salmonicolor]